MYEHRGHAALFILERTFRISTGYYYLFSLVSCAQVSFPIRQKEPWLLSLLFASSLSRVWLSATPQTIAHPAPLATGILQREYWRGLPCPTLGDLPNPGVKPRAPTWPADSCLSHREAQASRYSLSISCQFCLRYFMWISDTCIQMAPDWNMK